MKRLLTVLLAVALISLIGFFVAFAASGFDLENFPEVFYAVADDDFTEKYTELSLEDVNEIFVSGKSETVKLSNWDSDNISIKYFESDYKTTEIKNENGKISIVSTYEGRKWFNIKIHTGKTDYIEIKIPSGFEGVVDLGTSSGDIDANTQNSFSSLRLVTSSGDIEASGLVSKGGSELKTSSANIKLSSSDLSGGSSTVKTSSGSIKLNNCVFADAEIKTNSAGIRIDNCTFNDLTLNNRSGSIKLYSTTAQDITAESSSDNIEFHSVTADSVYAKTSSGEIEVTEGVFETASFKTSSDDIVLDIDCDDITAQTSSGKIVMSVKGSFADYKMDLKTSSGNISVDGQKYYSSILNPTAEKYIFAHTSSANVRISFE